MASDTIKNWETGVVDVASTTVATKITNLHGGESVTIKSLGASTESHFLGTRSQAEDSQGYKLGGGETVSLTLPIHFGKDNVIEIFAMATNAGDDVTFFKLSGVFPLTAASN